MSGGSGNRVPRLPTEEEVESYLVAPPPMLLTVPKPTVGGFTRPPPPVVPVVAPPQPQARPQAAAAPARRAGLLVAECQKGNRLMKYVKEVMWRVAGTKEDRESLGGFDFRMTPSCSALFLSLRYHLLHGTYLQSRISNCDWLSGHLRVLLVVVDVDDPCAALKEVSLISLRNSLTVILSWSSQEAARYLETYVLFERKGVEAIKEQPPPESDYDAKARELLGSVKSVNKTDVSTLLHNFRTVQAVVGASSEQLSMCPGLGPHKVKRLTRAFHTPLVVGSTQPGRSGAGLPKKKATQRF